MPPLPLLPATPPSKIGPKEAPVAAPQKMCQKDVGSKCSNSRNPWCCVLLSWQLPALLVCVWGGGESALLNHGMIN